MAGLVASPSPSRSSDGSFDLADLLEHEMDRAVTPEGLEEPAEAAQAQVLAARARELQEAASEALAEAEPSFRDVEGNEGPARKRARPAGPSGRAPAAAACPPHPGFIKGMCIRCGRPQEEEEEDNPPANVSLRYIHAGLQVSAGEAERLRAQNLVRVLATRKLLLVLDLDHTLLNSTRFNEVSPEHTAQLAEQMQAQHDASIAEPAEGGAPPTLRSLHQLHHMAMWTKLRPGLAQFLEAAHALYEMHVYTMGDREYAAEMARILDPSRRLFAERIISSGDSTQRSVKDLDVLLGCESASVILDDTEGVWPRHQPNLVQVPRYIYFPGCAARFGSAAPSWLERKGDEDPQQGLLTSLQVLREAHEKFFEQAEGAGGRRDVRRVLAGMQGRVLAGAHIVFTRVFPKDADAPADHWWRLAERLGAVCSLEAGEATTHIVAGGDHTDKARWGRAHAIPVVSIAWLQQCAFTWSRANEADFPAPSKQQKAPEPTPSALQDAEAALAAAGGGVQAEEGLESPG